MLHNQKIKFYFNLIFFFCLLQFLCGVAFTYHFYSSSLFVDKIFLFIRYLSAMSFYIFSFYLLLKNAEKINSHFYTTVKKILKVYFVLSLFISSFYIEKPFTIFSYIGYWSDEIIHYGRFCDTICSTFKILIKGTYF